MLRPLFLPSIAALVAGGLVASCSDRVAVDAPVDAGASDAPAAPALDAGERKSPEEAGPVDLACLGTEATMFVDRGLPFAYVKVGGQAKAVEFLVDYATTASTIDLDAFASPPEATNCDPSLLGQRCTFDQFDFFGERGPLDLYTDAHNGNQAGILATDLLAQATFTLAYAAQTIRRAAEPCSDATLLAAGFTVLDSEGFFAKSKADLRPLTDVIADADPSRLVPNVPTVPVAIGGATGHAQLDTGFADDAVPFSVNVNEAYLAAIPSGALVRDESKDLSLSTCAGVSEPVEAYRLATGKSFEIGAKSFPEAVIFVKRTPPAARTCGGIGTWTEPAAQIGLSFFVALDTLVFDPTHGKVWVR